MRLLLFALLLTSQVQAQPLKPLLPQNPTLRLQNPAPRIIGKNVDDEFSLVRVKDSGLWWSEYIWREHQSHNEGVFVHHRAPNGKKRETISLPMPENRPRRFVLSPDASLLAITLSAPRLDRWEDAGLDVWNIQSRKRLWHFSSDGNRTAFSPQNQKLAASHQDNELHQWDLATGKRDRGFAPIEEQIHALAYSPDGATLAVGTYEKVLLFDAGTGAKSGEIVPPRPTILAEPFVTEFQFLAWSPDGTRLACGGAPRSSGTSPAISVSVWNVNSKRLLHWNASPVASLGGLAWSPDGKRLAVARLASYEVRDLETSKSWLDVWDIPSNRLLFSFGGTDNETMRNPLFSSDGKSVFAVHDTKIKVWNLAPSR